MAAVTINSPGSTGERTKLYNGLLHRQHSVTVAADDDTWTSGIEGLKKVAWEPVNAGDACAVTITAVATGEITFNAGGAVDGILHTFSRR